MPHPYVSMRAKPGSNSSADLPSKAAPPSPQFTGSRQDSPASGPPQGPSRPEGGPNPPSHLSSRDPSLEELSPDELSLEVTEPFPPGLFRVPVPNAVFAEMPELSDSALRCLLALIHLSFRFDPAQSKWVCPERTFSRSDIEEASGLSDQGVRNGLSELESLRWADVDRSGHSHQHQLLLCVPERRFTYVPTALLEQATLGGTSGVSSGTELRVLLAVLRQTWGWTHRQVDPQSGREEPVHDRWAQLSNRKLAQDTGRSKTAVRQATQRLNGEWIQRVRPGNGPYQYRFLPERTRSQPEEEASFSEENANDLTLDRQNSGTPTFSRKSLPRDKHMRQEENASATSEREPSSGETGAVPTQNSSRRAAASGTEEQTSEPTGNAPPPDFSELSFEKRALAEKLSNVGVWAGRIAELLSRFSARRIQANFQLYRRQSAEQTIRNPGAWLCKAITDGYALPDSDLGKPSVDDPGASERESGNASTPGSLPPLEHKEIVSEAKKDRYVGQGVSEGRFQRCLSERASGEDRPAERRFMYFDPEMGGPDRRV